MRAASLALIALLSLSASAGAAPADDAREALASDPVYVHPRAAGRLSAAEQGRVRIAIAQNALGRMKIAVLPPQPGGAEAAGREIDTQDFAVRGTLLVASGPSFYAVTSHPNSGPTVEALRTAVDRHRDDGLAAILVDAVKRIARVDPGPAADIDRGAPSGTGVPDTEGFLDDVGDTFKLVGLIIAGAIALPFLLFAGWLLLRFLRAGRRAAEVNAHSERTVRDELVSLGDGIRSLDLDTSMPSADRGALAEYEQAIARYDQANDLLLGEPSAYEVEQAKAVISAGLRHVEAARRRLAG